MKNLFKLIFITLLLMGMSWDMMAQFTFSGEFRPRTEYRHGYKALAGAKQDAAFFTDQRTRLNFDYQSKGYRFYVSMQDVRVWGAQKQLVVTDGFTTTLHQAYAEVFLNSKFSVKAGRQEIIYDDHRIFGSVGWAQQARSHDAAIFKYKHDGLKVDVGLAFNQEKAGLVGTAYTLNKSYKTFQYLWLHKDLEKVNFSILALNNGQQVQNPSGTYEGVHYTQTLGTRVGYKEGKLAAFLSFYYQGGQMADSVGTKLNANLLGLDIAYKATDNVTLVGGYERQSGNSQTKTSDKLEAFTPFYGTNHKFNGFMDYFYVGNHGQSVGLQDAYLKFKYKKGKYNAGMDLHYFLAAADVSDGKGGALSAGLGTEIDLYMGTKIAEGVAFKLGYSHMIGTETMEAIKGGDKGETSNWGYMMLVMKPTFFKK